MLRFLSIGHMCHDLHQEDYLLGGAASYASILTRRLGHTTAALTSFGPDFQFQEEIEQEGITIFNKPAGQTTIFENRYNGDRRKQLMHQRASDLDITDLPVEWSNPDVVLLGPIADEINANLIPAFSGSLTGATIQGWLRQVNNKKEVQAKSMEWSLLKNIDVVFVSEEDLTGLGGALDKIKKVVRILILTQGSNGVQVFHKNQQLHFPVYPIKAIDPTGAGDIFAAAFLLSFAESNKLSNAVAYAHAAASLIVEKRGARLPDISAIDTRYHQYTDLFF